MELYVVLMVKCFFKKRDWINPTVKTIKNDKIFAGEENEFCNEVK